MSQHRLLPILLVAAALWTRLEGFNVVAAKDNNDAVCDLTQSDLLKARQRILQFLSDSTATSTVSPDSKATGADGKFHIQGWRWHTLSLAREADRLQKLAERVQSRTEFTGEEQNTQAEVISLIQQAVDYVVGFNMKGLHRIEKTLFFPWARTKMNSISKPEVVSACDFVMNQLESDRRELENLGDEMTTVLLKASKESNNPKLVRDALKTIESNSAAIASRARAMRQLEDSLLVPTIAQVVSSSEQQSFNNKVLLHLGILDSRLHLVAMHDAVEELNDQNERKLFEEEIPLFPRHMIPRWKRLLYEPRAGVLDKVR